MRGQPWRRAPGLLVAGAAILAILVALWVFHERRAATNTSVNGIPQSIGGPFALTDGHGNRVTDRDFRGKWLLIFFGYTHCPDVCPTTLSNLADTLAALGKAADRVKVLFVTLDPERDTPKVLLDYTAAFDSRIVGLTGSPEEIATTATAYHVKYAKTQSGDDYFVDHSALIHVLRPDGSYATFLFTDAAGLQMAKRLRELMAGG